MEAEESKTTNKEQKKKSSNKYNDTAEIEQLIDKIILENKEKLDKIYSKQIQENKFLLKNKDGNNIFYLKKKSTKKDEELLSGKIIDEARTNLGVDPLKPGEKIEGSKPKDKKDIKAARRIRFGRKKGKLDKDLYEVVPPDVDEAVESDDFQKVVDDIDNELENKEDKAKILDEKPEAKIEKKEEKRRFRFGKGKQKLVADQAEGVLPDVEGPKESDEVEETVSGFEKKSKVEILEDTKDEAKVIDEKIKETPYIAESSEPTIVPEVKATELAKKHLKEETFEEKPTEPMEQKENIEVPSSTKDPEDIKGKDEAKLIDEKIAEKQLKEDTIKEKSAEPLAEKSFFGRKKPEKIEEPKIEPKVKADDIAVQHRFRVENLPPREDATDGSLIDEKIKETPTVDSSKKNVDKTEATAYKLFEEHIKEKPEDKIKEGPDKKENVSTDDEEKSVPLVKESEHEHVFFDEDSTFDGWSPHVIEKEKKEDSLPISGKPEIATEDFKEGADIELPKGVLNVKSVKLTDLGFKESEWEELDFYPLHEPFAYVEILREKETLDKCYFLVEMDINSEEENLLSFIIDTMNKLSIDTEELELRGDDEYLVSKVEEVIREYGLRVNDETKQKLLYYLGKTSLGLGKIDPLMKDPNIEDISCDGAGVPLFLYHRQYGSLRSNIKFNDADELNSFVHKLAQRCGKHISIAEPMLDATMPDGSRIQMTLSDEVTTKGSTFTIRRFRDDPFSPPDLLEFNTMSSEMLAYLWLAVENGINTLFAGGTASGKTTALNALSLFIPRESKIVSIEETREINLPHPNWIPGVARSGFGEVVADRVIGEIDMYDLMKAALRQRPEYIIVGEIRGREAYVLFQAMATGHATYSTVHADSAQTLIHRLEGKPIEIPRVMLQSLDVISLHVITRVKNTRSRRCKQIIEIIDIDPTTKEILTNEVFRWDPIEDKFIYSGKSYVLERIRAEKDLSREDITKEIKNRGLVIEWMNDKNIREFREVSNIVSHYFEDPEEVLKQVNKESKK